MDQDAQFLRSDDEDDEGLAGKLDRRFLSDDDDDDDCRFDDNTYYSRPHHPSKGRRRNENLEHSDTFGVFNNGRTWVLLIEDRLAFIATNKHAPLTGTFACKDDAETAAVALATKENVKFWTAMIKRAKADPLTRDLPLGRAKPIADDVGRVFWRPFGTKTLVKPTRVVAKILHCTATGHVWRRACNLCNRAQSHPFVHCTTCFTPEERERYLERGRFLMNVAARGEAVFRLKSNCNQCGAQLSDKRRTKAGGNGMCSLCETRLTTQAAESGSEPPPAGKRWEDVCLDRLIELVPYPYEMRDSISNMLGSYENKRPRRAASNRGEQQCDTTTKRRPDLLYLRRDEETSRILVVISAEIDEDSHYDRKTECELGKIEDTFEAACKLAQREGFRDDRAGHNRADIKAPLVFTFKLNPNACDAKPAVLLDDRIALLAKRINDLYEMPQDDLRSMINECKNKTPIVECLFHHSKQAAHHLAAYAEAATSDAAWQWKGNTVRA